MWCRPGAFSLWWRWMQATIIDSSPSLNEPLTCSILCPLIRRSETSKSHSIGMWDAIWCGGKCGHWEGETDDIAAIIYTPFSAALPLFPGGRYCSVAVKSHVSWNRDWFKTSWRFHPAPTNQPALWIPQCCAIPPWECECVCVYIIEVRCECVCVCIHAIMH